MTHRYICQKDVAYRAIDGHVFLITPDGRQHELHGEVENHLWSLCEAGASSFPELVESITRYFEVSRVEATADLTQFLDDLVAAGIASKISK